MDTGQPLRADVAEWLERQGDRGSPVAISIIVPAFNEERRLPPTLIDIIDFFDARGEPYEIIVVDDGSTDETAAVVRKFERLRPQLRLLRIPKNHGKGHSVRTGALNARGALVLFVDADGATPIAEFDRLAAAVAGGAEVAFGSRALAGDGTRVSTRLHRRLMGRVFNTVVNLLVLPDVADTQCGFKLFTARAAAFLFGHQQCNGFGFDVELLLIARQAGISAREVPVNWTNVAGSKVRLITDSIRMLRDLFIFRVRHRQITPARYASESAARGIDTAAIP